MSFPEQFQDLRLGSCAKASPHARLCQALSKQSTWRVRCQMLVFQSTWPTWPASRRWRRWVPTFAEQINLVLFPLPFSYFSDSSAGKVRWKSFEDIYTLAQSDKIFILIRFYSCHLKDITSQVRNTWQYIQ